MTIFISLDHTFCFLVALFLGFPGGSVVKNLPANAGNTGSIAVLGRSPEEGNGNLLQYSCLGKSHGQRSLEEYSSWGRKRAGHDLLIKQHHEQNLFF